MKIGMDDGVKQHQTNKPTNANHNMIKLVTIMVIALFVGASFLNYWEVKQFKNDMKNIVEQNSQQQQTLMKKHEEQVKLNKEKQKLVEKQNKLNSEALERKKAAIKQALETCNYWYKENVKESTVSNRMNRDQSCALYTDLAH
jgi:uncharacterized protein HemX